MLDPYGTSFVGREAELERLEHLMRSGARLVTVLGAPGTGKSRLALRHAGRAPGGERAVHVLDVADAADARELGERVRDALGWRRAEPARDADDLLVLDNFEHLVAGAAVKLGDWLARAPELRILVTSRERLRVPGEQVLELLPLELPPPDADDLVAVLASEAGQLFAARAQQLTLRPEDGPLLADILHRLDGIPLAIELAAVRTAILDLAQLRTRLERRFELLALGPRGRATRQATLVGAIDWSWTLLSPVEQEALAQCSVFRGSFTLEAAEAVLDVGRAAEAPPSTMDVLHALAEKSLLRIQRPDDGGETRFCLYESIRDYAAEKLASSPSRVETAARHGMYYERLGSLLGRAGEPSRAGGLLARLSLEADDLLAAYERALRDPASFALGSARGVEYLGQLERLLAPRARLGVFWVLHHTAEDAVALVTGRAPGDPPARAAILRFAACASAALGRTAQAQRLFARALEQAEEARDPAVRGGVLYGIGAILAVGDLDERRAILAEALALAREAGDGVLEARTLVHLGNLYLDDGMPEEAITHWDSALERFRRQGGRVEEAMLLVGRAAAHQEQGRLEAARGDLDAAAALCQELGERRLWAGVTGQLGGVAHEQGEIDEAAALLRTAIEALGEEGARRMEGLYLASLAGLEAGRGRVAEARTALDAADARARDYGDRSDAAIADTHRALLDVALAREAAAAGDSERATALRRSAAARAAAVTPRASEHLRAARRLLRRALAEGAYVVAADGSWFRTPQGKEVSLGRRQVLRRLLTALVASRAGGAGAAVSSERLMEAGWPGENIDPLAAANRLHVGLTTLRNLGLRELLVRDESGYRIAPDVALIVQRGRD
ncbi:MAG TPA: tetratricopeptide repeat protein [Kofleriaceae bacterium]|nr:tetratricopeptide repeat protein [Kofleriaceae bacterium]